MDSSQLARLRKIEQFEFDVPGTRLRFVDRLARENGWSLSFSRRVINEYKRFCFLAKEAGHPVTPSEHVDQAWHLHLVYTRSYWEDFCPNYLGHPLHHGPTKGGKAEGEKHVDWYDKTIASYGRIFGETPPADIWPSSAMRFDRDLAWRRVNWRENWIIPKHWVVSSVKYMAGGLMLTAMVGCAANANPLDLTGPEFLALYLFLGVMCIFWNVLARSILNTGPIPPDSNPEVTDYELAYLLGDKERLFQTATVKLTQQSHLVFDASETNLQPGTPLAFQADPIERSVVTSYARGASPQRAIKSCSMPLEAMETKLIEAGLLTTPAKRSTIRWMTTIPFICLFLFGIIKIIIGITRDKPVGILVGFSIACIIVTLMVMASAPRLTGFGKRFTSMLRSRHLALRTDKEQFSPTNDHIGLPVALFGAGVLVGSAYDRLGRTLKPIGDSGDSSSSGGCSTDSGGGGGDGGGGGCGGCGGGGGD